MNPRKAFSIFSLFITLGAITLSLAVSARAQTESILYNFPGGHTGGLPESGVILDSAGNLYGTTWWGGANATACDQAGASCGTVYKLTPGAGGTWTETVLHNFSGDANGGKIFKGVVRDAAGHLYGTASDGGDLSACTGGNYNGQGCGVVFELSQNSSGMWKERVLHFHWRIGRRGSFFRPDSRRGRKSLRHHRVWRQPQRL